MATAAPEPGSGHCRLRARLRPRHAPATPATRPARAPPRPPGGGGPPPAPVLQGHPLEVARGRLQVGKPGGHSRLGDSVAPLRGPRALALGRAGTPDCMTQASGPAPRGQPRGARRGSVVPVPEQRGRVGAPDGACEPGQDDLARPRTRVSQGPLLHAARRASPAAPRWVVHPAVLSSGTSMNLGFLAHKISHWGVAGGMR